MKLEQQLTSLELSKRLKELGVKQNSHFYWFYHEMSNFWDIVNNHKYTNKYYSAFSVAELGELLPYTLRYFIDLEIYKEENLWIVKYVSFNEDSNDIIQNSKKLADAMAKMLIYLIKNKLVDGDIDV